MKEAVVTLVVVGGLLVATPAAFEGLRMHYSAALMEKPGVTNVTISNHLPEPYSLGCWLTGTGAIAAGVRLGFRSLRERNGGDSRSA